MKTLVISDIHSNIFALEAIWAQEKDCDLVLCAGDLVDYGPYPKEVIAWIQAHDVLCVQGNHDRWVVKNYRRGDTSETVAAEERAWVHHNAGLLDEMEVRFLEELPEALTVELDGISYGLTHLYREYDEIVSLHAFNEFLQQGFPRETGNAIIRLILGHTHRQAVRYLSDTKLWLNPGSVSYRRPDDPDQTAHYLTIVEGQIHLHRLSYDLRPLRRFVDEVRLSEQEIKTARWFWGRRE